MRRSLRFLAMAAFAITSMLFQSRAFAEEALPPCVSLGTVEEAIRFGLLHSSSTRYARMEALETMRLRKRSIRGFLPRLSVSFSENDSVRSGVADTREKRLEVTLTQPVYDGGKNALEYELGRIAAAYAYRDSHEQTRNLESRIAREYLDLALKKANLAIQDELLGSADEQLAIAKSEYENGVSLESDYLECMINRAGAEYDRLRLAREYESAERRFKITLGIDEGIALAIGETAREDAGMRSLSGDVEVLCERALAVSLEIARKRQDLRALELKARRWHEDFAPSVSMRCSLAFAGVSFPLTEPSFNVSVILGFDNPAFPSSVTSGYAFSGGKLGSVSNSAEVSVLDGVTWPYERRLGEISILSARLECERAERELRSAIRDAVYSIDDALARRRIKADSVALMAKKERISEQRAARGELKRVDLLVEMIAVAKARIELLSIDSDLENQRRALAIALDIPFGEVFFGIE